MPTPYYLQPEKTKLPEGHDDTLDPPEPPTDPSSRSAPPSSWPVVSTARGGTEPPDEPLGPPATHPARRSLAPFSWPVVAEAAGLEADDRVLLPAPGDPGPSWVIGPPARQLVSALGDLDPDIAMWPRTIVSRWPFTGPPTSGVWPLGWLGVDNTATVYVCTAGGQPGTWAPLGGQAGPPGPQGPPGPTGPQGPQGINGAAAGVGTPTAVTGSPVAVTATGPDTAKVFNFTIPPGATGATGPTGAPGQGVPPGGATNTVLAKASAADFATQWETLQQVFGVPPPVAGGVPLTSFTDPLGQLWIAQGSVAGGAYQLAHGVLHSRVYRNAAFSLLTGAGTPVQFDTASEDPYNLLITTGAVGEVLIPYAGRWTIKTCIMVTGTGSATGANLQIQRNRGGAYTNLAFPVWILAGATTNQAMIHSMTLTSALQAGDSIRVVATGNSVAIVGVPGNLQTTLGVDYIGL